jgi:hypothetical protein
VRSDGRWYCWCEVADLFGPVVEIRHGGRHRHGRVRLVAVKDAAESRAVVLRLEKRRVARGYVRA